MIATATLWLSLVLAVKMALLPILSRQVWLVLAAIFGQRIAKVLVVMDIIAGMFCRGLLCRVPTLLVRVR